MSSKKSTIGGAFSVLGKGLMGAPVAALIAAPMLGFTLPTEIAIYLWVAGFIIDCLGAFLAHLFSADKSDVRRMMVRNELEAETKFVTKEEANGDDKPQNPKPRHQRSPNP